jgi:hypothetical protein
MRHLLCLCAVSALVLAGCYASVGEPKRRVPDSPEALAMRMDRGDWMVNQGSAVYKVMAASAPNRPPRHIGYVEERLYRQMRGGPEFTIWVVTTLDRDEQIGKIDQLGRAVRYEPQRNGTFRQVALGSSSREMNIAAIFDTNDRVTLSSVSERRLAFEALDANGDGLLQANETRSFGDRISAADANQDGVVDFEEFDTIDIL